MAITDLAYLHQYSSNDKDFVQEMVELFLSSTPSFLEEMKSSFENKDYNMVARISHKMKPSMTFMGIKNGKEITIALEDYANEGTDIAKIEEKITELDQLCQLAFSELKVALNELKS
ncbi:Hpt domain-containing protein [Hyphobacterium sp. CCMP332]|nr:Hpt domain-containing protein [Hyphobacterium sp. CCMP332]